MDAVAAWEPDRLALTHFGEASDPEAQLDACREALHTQARLAAGHDLDGFVDVMGERVRSAIAPEEAEAALQAAPLHHLWLGLDRYEMKRLESAPPD